MMKILQEYINIK